VQEQVKSKVPYSAVVVGLGYIGMGYDIKLPKDDYVLSHVRALSIHKDFNLVSAVDPDFQKRQYFTAHSGLPAFAQIEDLLSEQRPDLVVVANPTSYHSSVLKSILDCYSPNAILCEKPLAVTKEEAQDMVAACKAAGVPLFVNFIRRAEPGVKEVQKRIVTGRITAPLKAVVWYSKGMFHNGSHFLDLMSYWMGPIRKIRLITIGRKVGENDIDADLYVEFELGSAVFCSAREEDYSHYTVEIVAGNGRLRYERGGKILWQCVEYDNNMSGYRRLSDTAEIIENDMNRYQYHVLEELSKALSGKKHTLSEGAEAVRNMAWLADLIQNPISDIIK
jgi:predicted dehydrogenase